MISEEWKDGPGLERPALDIFYRTERSFASSGRWLSSAGCVLVIVSNEYRAAAIVLLVMSLSCQLISWRAMRGAQRLEAKRLARMKGLSN